MRNMYQYVAESNPAMAKALCHKYGYKISGVSTAKDLGTCLEQLVAQEGEEALKDIIKNHPDREIILEVEETGKNFMGADGTQKPCGCGGSCKEGSGAYAKYVGFAGNEPEQNPVRVDSGLHGNQILAAAFLLGMAIIAAKM